MNKYAIYTDGLTYPVLEKDGEYYIGVPGTGHFSGQWKFLGVRERLKNSRVIIKPEDALKITDWKFKNGSPRYQVVDLDHGSIRTWAGTTDNQQLRSFDIISDNGFNLATKTDNDDEIVLEEEASQASGVASGVDGKIDSFPINPKEMEAQRLEESEDNIFDAREELLKYLNDNSKYDWDVNESYNNCVITESDWDYIEVFVDIIDGKKIYTVDDISYDSLEELSKHLPVLFSDDDENYDFDSGWEEDEEEIEISQANPSNVPSYEDLLKSGAIKKEDLTPHLKEIALLEDYEEESGISPQKQKFIDYCKDKIEDLGDIEIDDQQYHKLMHTEGIREFEDLYIIADLDDYESENLIAINNENEIVIDTPMIDQNGYAGTMQFDKIDKRFYDILMDYWDDLYMDEVIEED